MSLEDEVSRKLSRLQEAEEKVLQAEADRNAAEEKRRRELSEPIKEFASYLKEIDFPSLPLYVTAGKRWGLLTGEYSYYRCVGSGWVFTVDKYDSEYDIFLCDQFLSTEGILMSGSSSTHFFSSQPSKDGWRTGLPEFNHLISDYSPLHREVKLTRSSSRVMGIVACKASDVIAQIIHSRPGMPAGCEPGVLGYLRNY